MDLNAFLSELKRRRVFRVAAMYAVVGWIITQVAATTFPHLNLPGWMITAVIVLVALGFPVALVLAWAYDITPGGMVRTPAAPAAEAGLRGGAPWTAQRIAAVAGALVLALAGGAFVTLGGSFQRVGAPAEIDRSIAVLPFRNLSTDAENEYFSDGITEDVQRRLSRLGELRVTSVTSAMSFKGTTRKLREIGDELGVAHLVEGSVRRVGDRLRISVTLVDARTDQSLWTEEYDREVTDVFAIQAEIAEQIAQALRLRLTASDRARVGQAGTSSLAAYELYLKAREQETRIGSDIGEARALRAGRIALLRQAIAIDPQFAPALARLSSAYLRNPDMPLEAGYDSAVAYARLAIRAAPELADGYAALGTAYRSRNPVDPGPATTQFRRALELDPNHVEALRGLARVELASINTQVDALRYLRRASVLAPNDPGVLWEIIEVFQNLGAFDAVERWYPRIVPLETVSSPWIHHCDRANLSYRRGDADGAARHVRRMLEDAPDTPFAWQCAGAIELRLGHHVAARAHLERYAATISDDDVDSFDLAYLLMQAGDRARGERLLAAAEKGNREMMEYCNQRCWLTGQAMVHAIRGEKSEALRFLLNGRDIGWNGWYPTPGVRLHPAFKILENEPEYQALMSELRAAFDRQREQAHREGLLEPPGAATR